MRALIAGWFSFEGMGATAGDLLTRDVMCGWLDETECSYDIATAPPFGPGVDWKTVEPSLYSHVVFVCGPLGNGWPVDEFLARFSDCELIGLNLSMLQRVDEWNPFDLLVERDSPDSARPDLSFLSPKRPVPVVGVVLVHEQKEYADGLHEQVRETLDRFFADRDAACMPIDTRLDIPNESGLTSPAQIESAIAKMDLVVTTRLHGLALSLKNGVPVIAIDPISGGGKVLRQAESLGWPVACSADQLTEASLEQSFAFCLTDEAVKRASECAEAARASLADVRTQVLKAFDKRPAVRD